VKDALSQEESSSHKSGDETSFIQVAKAIGSGIAHEIYDEITDIVKIVPQFCQEVGDCVEKFKPDCVKKLIPDERAITAEKEMEGQVEYYERIAFKGHQVIDYIFSTDQAKDFTPDAKANDPRNEFTYGTPPFPGSSGKEVIKAGKTLSQAKKYKKAGKVLDRAAHIGKDRIVPLEKSKVYEKAIKQKRHAKTVRDAMSKPAKENQKSIRSHKKNIAEHKEKIANPKEAYKDVDWDSLTPEHQARQMKRWSSEIKGWEEQIEWLEEILEERMNYGE